MDLITVSKFKDACDGFIQSKFILFDRKLEVILNAIADSDDVYNLIARSLKSFDFETEKNASLAGGKFRLPAKAEKVVALVFCILSDIDEHKTDFYKFLNTSFPCDDINESFKLFCQNAIVPFKNTILILLEAGEEVKKQIATLPKAIEEVKVISAEKQKILDCLTELKDIAVLKPDTSKSVLILNAMSKAVKDEDDELFSALGYAFFNSTKNKKFLKYAKEILTRASR